MSNIDPRQCLVALWQGWARVAVRESHGRNRGPWVDAIHHLAGRQCIDAHEWCAQAVVASWEIVAMITGKIVDRRICRSGSVSRMWTETRRKAPELAIATHGRIPLRAVEPGDLLIRLTAKDWPDGTETYSDGHVEVILGTRPDGRLVTVAGNTDADDARTGGGVYVHDGRYSWDDPRIMGFIALRWQDE